LGTDFIKVKEIGELTSFLCMQLIAAWRKFTLLWTKITRCQWTRACYKNWCTVWICSGHKL